MCISQFSQLNPGALIKHGGTVTVSAALVALLKSQRRSTLGTDQHLYREGDGFEFRIDIGKGNPRVTLLRGVVSSIDNRAICYVDRIPMRGYRLTEVVLYEDEVTIAKPMDSTFKNLRELTSITGLHF